MKTRAMPALAAAASVLFLAACGGGGAGGSSSMRTGDQPDPDPDPPPPVPAMVAGASATVATVPDVYRDGRNFYVVADDARFPGRHEGRRAYYDYEGWGLVIGLNGNTLFKGRFYETDHLPDPENEYAIELIGTPTGTNPVSGTASWLGIARAAVAHPDNHGMPVEGHARVAVDLSVATVDVDLTGFTHGHRDMSWRSLRMSNGVFSHRRDHSSISGAFYGPGHEGVAGRFSRDQLDGIFAAARK